LKRGGFEDCVTDIYLYLALSICPVCRVDNTRWIKSKKITAKLKGRCICATQRDSVCVWIKVDSAGGRQKEREREKAKRAVLALGDVRGEAKGNKERHGNAAGSPPRTQTHTHTWMTSHSGQSIRQYSPKSSNTPNLRVHPTSRACLSCCFVSSRTGGVRSDVGRGEMAKIYGGITATRLGRVPLLTSFFLTAQRSKPPLDEGMPWVPWGTFHLPWDRHGCIIALPVHIGGVHSGAY
jgi:hypothetical protein